MKAIIVGGGVGGLTTALMLRARGIGCELFEQADQIRELGVGINTLPHAIRELAGLGLLQKLDDVAIRTDQLYYLNRHGQEVWREARGIDAGHDVPQFSIHRGRLQSVIHRAVEGRLGKEAIHTGCRLGALTQDEGGVTAHFFDRTGSHIHTVRGDILIGADGIHSRVRDTLFANEGPPSWNGLMLWRGARDWPMFLTGKSMIVAGGLHAKVVVYPIARRLKPGKPSHQLGGAGEDRRGRRAAAQGGLVAARQARGIDAACRALLGAPCRRAQSDLGDAGILRISVLRPRPPAVLVERTCHAARRCRASDVSSRLQRRLAGVVDARCLADELARAEHPRQALRAYEQKRLPMTAEIVRANRRGGPEGVIDAVEQLAPDGFNNVEHVLSYAQREAIVRGYASKAGFAAVPGLTAVRA